jgi:hypothetical protein
VVHWRGYSNRDIGNAMPGGSMDRSYREVVVGQELKDAEGASDVTLIIKNGGDYMRRCDEDAVLSNEEAGPDRNKEAVWPLRHDREDGLVEVNLHLG